MRDMIELVSLIWIWIWIEELDKNNHHNIFKVIHKIIDKYWKLIKIII